MKREYRALGWWWVTTEGAMEGKTVKDLGKHYGYLDEIAFKLGGKAYYSLHFEAIDEPVQKEEVVEPVSSVQVQLGINSGTWDMQPIDRVEAVRQILKGRPVVVGETAWYASFILKKS